MMNLKNLNGWQRLWVVISVLWLLFVVVRVSTAVDVIPTADRIEARLERNTRNLQREWALATIEAALPASGISEATATAQIYRSAYEDWSDTEIVEKVRSDFPSVNYERVDSDHQESLDGEQTRHQERLDALRLEQAKRIGLISLALFAPSVGLYLLGLAMAWVWRGFKLKGESLTTTSSSPSPEPATTEPPAPPPKPWHQKGWVVVLLLFPMSLVVGFFMADRSASSASVVGETLGRATSLFVFGAIGASR